MVLQQPSKFHFYGCWQDRASLHSSRSGKPAHPFTLLVRQQEGAQIGWNYRPSGSLRQHTVNLHFRGVAICSQPHDHRILFLLVGFSVVNLEEEVRERSIPAHTYLVTRIVWLEFIPAHTALPIRNDCRNQREQLHRIDTESLSGIRAEVSIV